MDFGRIKRVLKNEPAFRQKQVRSAIFKNLIEGWNEATNLSAKLRQELAESCPLDIKSEIFISKDERTVRALIYLEDGLKAESVLMRHRNRQTICVSSQVGCPLGCLFCATGQMGFKRNLTGEEIVVQVLFFARYLKKQGEKIDNVVFMGMGEPFLNYDNVLQSIKLINDKDGLNIGMRHISLSTIGIPEKIKDFSKEQLQVNLAISLHAPNDKLRSRLMPINKKYSLKKVLAAVKDYVLRNNRKVMIEYIMIRDVNDSPDMAEELARLLLPLDRHLFMVNLITYNPTGVFRASSLERIKEFKNILMQKGIEARERQNFGLDIKGACGQLASGRSL